MAAKQAREAVNKDAGAAANNMLGKFKKSSEKKGSKTGLKAHEIRLTIVLTDEQNALLHDWARTRNCAFKVVTEEMAQRYIDQVISKFVKDGHKLRRTGEPPKEYVEWYEPDTGAVDFSKYAGA